MQLLPASLLSHIAAGVGGAGGAVFGDAAHRQQDRDPPIPLYLASNQAQQQCQEATACCSCLLAPLGWPSIAHHTPLLLSGSQTACFHQGDSLTTYLSSSQQ